MIFLFVGVRYISERGKIWGYYYRKWFCDDVWIPLATFYEKGGDREKRIKFGTGRFGAEIFLVGGDDVESVFCSSGRIYYPKRVGKKWRVIRTGILERIGD